MFVLYIQMAVYTCIHEIFIPLWQSSPDHSITAKHKLYFIMVMWIIDL